jgi:hypothetical protein
MHAGGNSESSRGTTPLQREVITHTHSLSLVSGFGDDIASWLEARRTAWNSGLPIPPPSTLQAGSEDRNTNFFGDVLCGASLFGSPLTCARGVQKHKQEHKEGGEIGLDDFGLFLDWIVFERLFWEIVLRASYRGCHRPCQTTRKNDMHLLKA